jgi:hypothetical protein
MPKRKQQSTYSAEQTMIAFAVGCLAGAGIAYVVEITYGYMIEIGEKLPGLPGWRAHTATACLGLSVFMLTFYLLEILGRESKTVAWRASSPWLPLVGLTAAATIVHVPTSVVIITSLVYSVWAFRRMCSIR